MSYHYWNWKLKNWNYKSIFILQNVIEINFNIINYAGNFKCEIKKNANEKNLIWI